MVCGPVMLDIELDRDLWRDAGKGFAEYAVRRRESGGDTPRRILADFVIGAHAASRTNGLISFNSATAISAVRRNLSTNSTVVPG